MYEIEKKGYGYKLTFSGSIDADEMSTWVKESKEQLSSAPTEFGVFVDMRTLQPLDTEAQASMEEGQKLYKATGMVRSVVVVASAIVRLQFARIARETGIYEWERYIDASSVPDWENVGIAWITEGVDPDDE